MSNIEKLAQYICERATNPIAVTEALIAIITVAAPESEATIKLLTRLISTLFIKSADLHLTCIQILI